MREVPCDIGPEQEEFEEIVCALFEEAGYEVLDRNPSHDPFEPDIVLMDEDEWVLTVLCYFTDDVEDGRISIFPKTMGMRRWVTDHDDRPAFLVLGVGGRPSDPDTLYFARFDSFPDGRFELGRIRRFIMNWMRADFLDDAVRREFERIFSPS